MINVMNILLMNVCMNIVGWSPSKFIKISKKLNPQRKKKIIRKLVKSGANKQKIAEFFKISLRRVQDITTGIKQKKFNSGEDNC